jgi:hypothetical protein
MSTTAIAARRSAVPGRHAPSGARTGAARIATPREAVRRYEAERRGGPVPPSVYRRRRLVASALAVLVSASVVLLAARVGHAGAELDGPAPQPPVYVVQPGDTLWSIAAEVAPDSDRRDTVGRLADAAGGTDLVPGQRIVLGWID